MANEEHLAVLREGIDAWNRWRIANEGVRPDLSEAFLIEADLSGANLTRTDLTGATLAGADLIEANLSEANLIQADLTGANLSKADLSEADLTWTRWYRANLSEANLSEANLTRANLARTDLTGADLFEADLSGANLTRTDLTGATLTGATLYRAYLTGANLTRTNLTRADLTRTDLSEADLFEATLTGANLTGAQLVDTTIEGASLSGAYVYGTAAWNLKGEPADQTDLVITPPHESAVTVDDLKVAQFIYLLLSNPSIRDVIDTITSKVVLILGRFTEERKRVLDALRDELRNRNLTPVLFDFNPSAHQDFTDTVTLLARMARFVIADLSDPMSVQQELTLIARDVMVAVQPIILTGQKPWAMFSDLQRRSHWLLPLHEYQDLDDLLERLQVGVIEPAEAKRKDLLPVITAEAT